MRAAISYFYQIRFFKPYMIPLSTAIWDPKWFHDGRGQEHVFRDRNGVINGLRIQPLMPSFEGNNDLCHGREKCSSIDPEHCEFRRRYAEQLEAYDINIFEQYLEKAMRLVAELQGIPYESVLPVFIVYETPDNQCSERVEMLRWFDRHGRHVEELRYPITENY